MVLNDWQRGRILFFVKPPGPEGDPEGNNPLPVGPAAVLENVQEEQSDNPDTGSEEQQQRRKEQVQKILAGVRQNFSEINVAPEFCEEDLVPAEMPDLDMSDFSGSEDEEDGEEDEGEEEDGTSVESTTSETDMANCKKSSRAVIRELDEKIAKYKQFLDKAKSKRFSAIQIPKALSEKVFTDIKTKQAAAAAAAQEAQKKGSQSTWLS